MLYPAGQQFGDSNMDPVSSGSLYVYETGTTTLASIYSDTGLTATLTNPVVLDSSGRVPSNIYVSDAAEFTVEVRTSGNAQVFSRDNVFGWSISSDSSTLIVGDSAGAHVEIGSDYVQAKSDATTYTGIDVNPSGGKASLYGSGSLKARTADEAATGNVSGLEVKDGGGTLRPVGFNITPITNISGSTALRQANVGHLLLAGSNGESLTIDTTTDDAPNGAVWVYVNRTGGDETITPSGVTLRWLDGAGSQTGTRTIADGSYVTVTKTSNGNYNLVGNGIS